jgi:hypothetical protein
MKIVKWIRDGNDGLSASGLEDDDDLLDAAGRALDHACSWDIMGEVLFLADDGKHYVGCVEFMISEANPEYVAECIAEEEEYA